VGSEHQFTLKSAEIESDWQPQFAQGEFDEMVGAFQRFALPFATDLHRPYSEDDLRADIAREAPTADVETLSQYMASPLARPRVAPGSMKSWILVSSGADPIRRSW